MKRARISKEVERQIVSMMQAGAKNKAIRHQFKMPSSSVSNIRRRHGINYKPRTKYATRAPKPVEAQVQSIESSTPVLTRQAKAAITKRMKKQNAVAQTTGMVNILINGITMIVPKERIQRLLFD